MFGIFYNRQRSKQKRLDYYRQLQCNHLITRVRYVVERTFGSQVRWFGSKILCYCGLTKAHAWHILQTMAYNLKDCPNCILIAYYQHYHRKNVSSEAVYPFSDQSRNLFRDYKNIT